MGADSASFRSGLMGAKVFTLRSTYIYVSIATAFAFFFFFFTPFGHSSEFNTGVVHEYRAHQDPFREHGPGGPHPEEKASNGWSFHLHRDARNFGLSEEQCHVAFPDLYHEINRAVAYRKDRKIKIEEVETGWRGDGIARVMIWQNQLYIIENRGIWDQNHRPRALATLHALHRAITAYPGILPNIEFTVTDHDSAAFGEGEHTTWAYSRLPEQESLWLMPDFGLWGWPDVGLRSYSELQYLIEDSEVEFVDKKPKLVWRGSVHVGSHDVRAALIDKSAGQYWSDVRELDWSNATNIAHNLISMDEHCQYMFVAQTEGNTYSGRLKYLLNCQSIIVSHDLRFLEHFTHLMVPSGPDQNFVRVQRDFSDLQAQMEFYLSPAHTADADRIAHNARATFRDRYLTPAAEACYWRQLMRGWSEVQGFETEFWKEVVVEKNGRQVRKRKPRGVPFESFVIMEAVEWDLPSKPRRLCVDG